MRAVKKLLKGMGSIDYSRELKVLSKVSQKQVCVLAFVECGAS